MHPDSQAHLFQIQSLYVQHLPALRGFVLSLVSDFALVDDVVQETFLTVTKKADDFQLGSNFRAWVWTIARFKVLQMLEKARHAADRLSPVVIETLCAHEDAENDWETEQQLGHLKHCIEHLAPKAKQAVTLRYEQAQKPPEIARLMGWTVDAVNVSLSRVRVALRKCVETLIAWVRVDSLPRLQNALVLGDSFQPGETHWFITREGGIGLGVRGHRGDWVSFKSSPVITPEARGSWLMLATVFNGHETDGKITVTNYCNGHPLGDIVQHGPHCPLELGTFEIGNWAVKPGEPIWKLRGYQPRSQTDHIRNLQGRIDKLAVLRVALSKEDIEQVYQSGRLE